MRFGIFVTAIGCLCLAQAGQAEETAPRQTRQSFERTAPTPAKLAYWLYLPADYEKAADKKWPVLLFLHGSGERGDNLDLVKKHGPPKLADKQDYPFLIVSPQCPTGERWQADVLLGLLDDLQKKHRIDASRIYVTGLSMGGSGTWDLAAAAPGKLAAVVPICGRGDPAQAEKMKGLPTWIFHGAKDGPATVENYHAMVAALKAADANFKATLYPDAAHDSWTATYANPELYKWLLEQTRK